MAFYTPSQVAEMLHIGKSTLRKYAALFSMYLSDAANRPQRNYSDNDVSKLQKICELRAKGVKFTDIPSQLGIVETNLPDNSLVMLPQINAEFQKIYDTLAKLTQDQQEQINILQARIDQLENDKQLHWYQKILRSSTKPQER